MANVPQAVPQEPTTFGELFQLMPDVYNGVYIDLLQEYAPDDARNSNVLLQSTLTRFPVSQVPALFAYVGTDGLIGTVHHLHRVEVPLGRPSPWMDTTLAFVGDIVQNQIAYTRIEADTFLDNTEAVVVPTVATMGAALTALAGGMHNVGPYNAGDPDTKECRSRRAVPVPYPYVQLMFGRQLTPREAWEQVGSQVVLDQREGDCAIFLNFLRVAATHSRGRAGQPRPPANIHPAAFVQPMADAALLAHIGQRLRALLPVTTAPGAVLGPQFAHATNVLRAALLEDRDQDRAERAEDRAERAIAAENAAAATTFSGVFPAAATGIRRLCQVGEDDDLLPSFWKQFAAAKGKKAQSMSAFTQLVTACANEANLPLPVVTAQLYNHVVNFELGSSDLSNITKGISPFLVCPQGYHKAGDEESLAQQYRMIHNDAGSTPSLTDVRYLIAPTYNLPDSLYQLVEFIGAYTVIWEVLSGSTNLITLALREHHRYWQRMVTSIRTELPS